MLKCTGLLSESTALARHNNMTGVFAFLSLGYKVKAFLSVGPGNTAAPLFQQTVLMCFHTGASSQPVPGQMPLLEVPNMDFL